MPGLAAALFQKADITDDNALVDRFAHVIARQPERVDYGDTTFAGG